MSVHSSFRNCYASSRSISLAVLIAPQSALITGSLTPSVIGGRPSHPIYRVERTSSRAGVAPADVQAPFTAHSYDNNSFEIRPTPRHLLT
jgi:hypothetical protein